MNILGLEIKSHQRVMLGFYLSHLFLMAPARFYGLDICKKALSPSSGATLNGC
jgi:hypothetical protein